MTYIYVVGLQKVNWIRSSSSVWHFNLSHFHCHNFLLCECTATDIVMCDEREIEFQYF